MGYILPLRTSEFVSGRISMISLWFGCLSYRWKAKVGEISRYRYLFCRSNVVMGVGVGRLMKQRRALMKRGWRCAW